MYPHLAHLPLEITDTAPAEVAKYSDVVFLALPHKTAQEVAVELHGRVKIIDLSADFRLDDASTYAAYYEEHKYPDLLKEFVYGLPETVGRDKISKAQSVANPGCFALVSQLLLHPFKGKLPRPIFLLSPARVARERRRRWYAPSSAQPQHEKL